MICPIPCGIVFGYFGEKIDENDYEIIDMVMICGWAGGKEILPAELKNSSA